MVLKDLLPGLRDLVQRFEPADGSRASLVTSWASQSGGEVGTADFPLPVVVKGGSGGLPAASAAGEALGGFLDL